MKGVTADQEASLLQQLTEITRVMQERHLAEEAAPEKKSWEGNAHTCSSGGGASGSGESRLLLSTDYFEGPGGYWEESERRCPHRRMEAEAERTHAGEAHSETVPEDVAEAEVPNREAEEDKRPENGGGVSEREERGEGTPLGVQEEEEELPGGLDQLERPLTTTPVLEQEETGSSSGLTEDVSGARRRRKRGKGRRAPH